MADWDADSPHLHQNLAKVRARIQRDARKRVVPTVAVAKVWQKTMMAGLTVPDPLYVGRFRGEAGLQNCQVRIGSALGVPPADVADELQLFEGARSHGTPSARRLIRQGEATMNRSTRTLSPTGTATSSIGTPCVSRFVANLWRSMWCVSGHLTFHEHAMQ